jgi:hypothetical protein
MNPNGGLLGGVTSNNAFANKVNTSGGRNAGSLGGLLGMLLRQGAMGAGGTADQPVDPRAEAAMAGLLGLTPMSAPMPLPTQVSPGALVGDPDPDVALQVAMNRAPGASLPPGPYPRRKPR